MFDFSEALPRLRSSVWVDAYVRRCRVGDAFVAISRRGDPSAGAIFIECLHDRGADLYAPRTRGDGGRGFERILTDASGPDVADRMARERSFDLDLWLVTVEDRAGRTFLLEDECG